MGVAVYPRLGELLRARNLTVAELERQIEERFGLSVDAKTLYRLTYDEPVQRADLEIAGAAAAILGVSLNDLFDIEAIPVQMSDEPPDTILTREQSRRLAELFDQQARRPLSADERTEIEALVAEYGRRLHEQRVREYAAQRGISVEDARRGMESQFEKAIEWWQAFQADPRQRRRVAALVRRRRSGTAE